MLRFKTGGDDSHPGEQTRSGPTPPALCAGCGDVKRLRPLFLNHCNFFEVTDFFLNYKGHCVYYRKETLHRMCGVLVSRTEGEPLSVGQCSLIE